jgi:hypothetical protein
MKNPAVDKMLEIEEFMRTDENYQHLMAEYETLNTRFLSLLEELEEVQQDIIYDYLGVLIQMHMEMLLKACE